jgi:small subunit ribosomal protein S15e
VSQAGKTREDRVFKKFMYRGIDLDTLLGLSKKDLMDKLLARQRRRLSSRGLQPKTQTLINKLRAAKKAAPPGEKPAVIKTHLRNMVILPEMIGSVIGVYNGKVTRCCFFFLSALCSRVLRPGV